MAAATAHAVTAFSRMLNVCLTSNRDGFASTVPGGESRNDRREPAGRQVIHRQIGTAIYKTVSRAFTAEFARAAFYLPLTTRPPVRNRR
jgi:hypothetical protein